MHAIIMFYLDTIVEGLCLVVTQVLTLYDYVVYRMEKL